MKSQTGSAQIGGEEQELIRAAVARLRIGILATVFAMVGGVGLWLATVWLIIRGGLNVGENLSLLGQYFPGYAVTWTGSLLGFFYGGVVGGGCGWLMAWIYNLVADLRNGREGG